MENLSARPFRDFAAEHRAHVERFNPDGTLKGSEAPFGNIRWHVGTVVKGSGDPRKDIADARRRLIRGEIDMEEYQAETSARRQQTLDEAKKRLAKNLGSHVSDRLDEMGVEHERQKEERRRKREALAEEARIEAEKAAEQAELEAIANMAVAEIDPRYTRF